MSEDTVVYVQCPHCKKGWYGKFLNMDLTSHEDGTHRVDNYSIQGINPTNLTEPILCLNCHKYYTPLEKETYIDFEDGAEKVSSKGCVVKHMPEFVAERLTTCKGS